MAPQFFQQQLLQQQLPQQLTSQSQHSLPSMIEFLQQINETEETGDYFVKFLEGFEKQRVKVKYLYKLSDMQFKDCGVITIGNIETIREVAKKYK